MTLLAWQEHHRQTCPPGGWMVQWLHGEEFQWTCAVCQVSVGVRSPHSTMTVIDATTPEAR